MSLNILTYQLHQAVQRVLAKFSICESIYRKNVKKPMRGHWLSRKSKQAYCCTASTWMLSLTSLAKPILT